MDRRNLLLTAIVGAAAAAVGAGRASGEVLSNMVGRAASAGPRPRTPLEIKTLSGLRPPKRKRPVVAVLGHQDGVEVTDFMTPYSVLVRSGLAIVQAVAPSLAPIPLKRGFGYRPQLTFDGFERRHPEGADYVIVPALTRDDDPVVLEWIRTQASRRATVVGICSGVRVLSLAGLLRDREATGYWMDVPGLLRSNPGMRWARDQRIVADRGVATTTGISASLPAALALVEAIGGRAVADSLTRHLGAPAWSLDHDSAAFDPGLVSLVQATRARGEGLPREFVGLPAHPGVEGMPLAFTADAYSRTYRTTPVLDLRGRASVRTAEGLTLVPLVTTVPERELPTWPKAQPARALDVALEDISLRYGSDTAHSVALELEYPWREA